jgi:hypothetical protein
VSLEQLNVISKPCEIPDEVTAMLAEAEQRCDAFFEAGLDRRYPRYLPSNPEKVLAAIATLKESGILRGDVFCEWGSGFGIATCMASLIGFKAYGIEIEDGLVKLSTELAQDLSIPAEYLCTSYLPEGYEECEGIGGKDLLPPQATTSGGAIIDTTPLYDGLDPGEVDLFFVYPWPGQEEFMMDLFDEVASEDAILLIYQADGETTVHRQSFNDEN